VILFLHARPPPDPPHVLEVAPPPPPPPIATTQTEVTPAGAVQLYVPGVVYSCWPSPAYAASCSPVREPTGPDIPIIVNGGVILLCEVY
jgi:hypothetical protein